jgi:hypothetical protein
VGEGTSTAGPPVGEPPRSAEELQGQIAQTRADLGDTVAALAEKTDVKARLRERVSAARARGALLLRSSGERVTTSVRRYPVAAAVGGASLAGVVMWRVVKR